MFYNRKIRLGYPFLIEVGPGPGKALPAGWFWGHRGEYSEHPHPWTDSTYRVAKSLDFKNVPRFKWGYLAETCLDLVKAGKSLFEYRKYTDYIQGDEPFIVPIQITGVGVRDLEYLDRVLFPEDLLQYIQKGKAKVLFFSHVEGMNSTSSFQHIQNFCKNNRLKQDQVSVFVANMIASDLLPKNALFSLKEVNYFAEEPWFLPKSKLNYTMQERTRVLEGYVKGNRDGQFYATFLCLNRRPDWFRNYLGAFFKSVGNLPKISQVSLGLGNEFQIDYATGKGRLDSLWGKKDRLVYYPEIEQWYLEQSDRVVAFSPDEQGIQFKNRVDFAEDMYRGSFLTVVTETYFDLCPETYPEEPRVFFSEKTFKPMYGLRPFILVGAPGSLKKLRELGYRTFNRWWDESYDSIGDSCDRMNAICEVILGLSKKSKKELQSMLLDMENVLTWNWNRLMSTFDIEDTLQCLVRLSSGSEKGKVVSLV